MDWNLRSCGRKGHETYAPDEPELRARLHVETPVGEAWRCLRCGDFVPGGPRRSGPAEDAPIVMRGRALRDAVVLRLLAVERFLKGLLVLAGAYGVWRFRADRDALQRAYHENLPLLEPLAEKFHWGLKDSSIVHTIEKVFAFGGTTLLWIAAGLVLYGSLQLIEGVGLWLLKRWGEYFAVVATSLFIPIEIYELAERVTWVRIGALVVNIAAVLYILLSKRLFGLRGGAAAHEAERHETSLLEVEDASTARDVAHPARPATHG
ncbi:hypothetical protein Lfu02_57620 [Longispora fulva]|uniref:Uncharacterized membrane protein (DUF2068 family) n=1 Tax=Longispora fulva TaxID=619741 RepID=A0A8J7GIE0_9ACTN|nr:DUF2127 domain-containing protein [Longispora fulva]MBG6137257.1 uncharacterized membrane protein (DUF2068 family) [Longispora fulva]GIG61390.1 hypothetical protein Lfu02_57620 [Longispora fulva]